MMMNKLDEIRVQFPSLKRKVNGSPLIFMDGPGGTQVPDRVINAVSNYYRRSNANAHGAFTTTKETDKKVAQMRSHLATFLGAEGPSNISIGQNMTTLNYALSRAFSRVFQPGDEVLITQLDHEANRGPWLALRDHGIIVKEVRLLPSGVLDYKDLSAKLNERTRLVAMGMSSNALGTVNDYALVRQLTYQVGAQLLLDAVHYAPHFKINVRSIGCDYLLCSAYKFYGPHIGILYTKTGLLDQLPTDRLRTADQHAPYSIETGTLNHAAMTGVTAAIDFMASIGEGQDLSSQLASAYDKISSHEFALAKSLHDQLSQLPGLQIIGQDFSSTSRTPTVSLTLTGYNPTQVCEHLAQHNICAWDGHFYALRAMECLGLAEAGGVTRLGISMYNTQEEIDKVCAIIARLI